MKRKSILLLIILFLGLGVLVSLMSTNTGLFHQTSELLEISVIVRSADSGVWASARQGMEQAADDFGVELRFLTPIQGSGAQEQRAMFLQEVDNGADGVILVPADPASMAEDVRQAAGRTAVVTLESSMAESGAAACISVDNPALGEALALAALAQLDAGQRILLVDGVPGSTGIAQRLAAAGRILEAEGIPVSVLAPESGTSLADQLTARLVSGEYAAVITFDAATLELAAKTAQNLTRPPLLFGMGATTTIAACLEQGYITAIAAQNEFAAGYLAVEAAVRAVRNQQGFSVTTLEYALVDVQTMHLPENQKLLFPVT